MKFAADGNMLFYSQGSSINLCDLKSDKLILNDNYIKNLFESDVYIGNEDNHKIKEINDFSITQNEEKILINDQDNDRFLFFDFNKSNYDFTLRDNFTLSSAYTQTFTRKDECILCSFEGGFIKYNYTEKKIKSEKNIKNFLPVELKPANSSNYLTNPPFVNKCLYNPYREEILFGMLNGVLLNLKNNMKTNFVKLIHNGMVREIKIYNKSESIGEFLMTIGKDKIIKIIDLDQGEIKLNIDLNEFKNEDPCMIESDSLGNIFYVDGLNNNLKILKIK